MEMNMNWMRVSRKVIVTRGWKIVSHQGRTQEAVAIGSAVDTIACFQLSTSTCNTLDNFVLVVCNHVILFFIIKTMHFSAV